MQYWPGSDQIDWIGADGYNFYQCGGRTEWRTFDAIYTGFIRFGERHMKPLDNHGVRHR